jgi:drug/metabolite transporter (DMT)-like permease
MDRKENMKAYLAWAAVCFFWGTTYLAIRIGVESVPPALFAGFRFFAAGLVLLPFLLVKGYRLPRGRELLDNAIIGIALLSIANGTVVWAEQWIPSSLAALIVATLPFFMVGMEAALPRGDKLNLKKVLGILVGFSGLVLLLWPDIQGSVDPNYLKGIFAMLIPPIAWGAGSLYSKYRNFKTHPFMGAAIQMLIAGSVLIAVGTLAGEFSRLYFSPKGFAAIGYLLVFGSIVGYGSYIYALAKLPASLVSMYAYINPVIAVFLGWLILGERLDWMVAAATLIIVAGVMLVKTAPQKKTIPEPVEKIETPNFRQKEESLEAA